MHFDERDEGEYRIYAGAIETPDGGYRATAVVMRMRGVARPVEVFRDENLSGGHAWEEPERALRFAIKTASSIVRERALVADSGMRLAA
jgi:hypothetical protein